MKQYGKKIGRGLKGSRYLDNGCPCCGREHDNKGATRSANKKEIEVFLNELYEAGKNISGVSSLYRKTKA